MNTAYPSLLYVVALLSIGSFVDAQSLNQVVECTTPSGDFGSCILLESCAYLVRFVSSGNPASLQVLRKSQCGFVGTKPKVCCANNPNPILFRDPETTTVPPKSAGDEATLTTVPLHTTTARRPPEQNIPTNPPALEASFTVSPIPLLPIYSTTQVGNTGTTGNGLEDNNDIKYFNNNQSDGSQEDIASAAFASPTIAPNRNSDVISAEGTHFKGDQLPSRNACGTITITNKIYGGKNTSIDDFPWMALLKYKSDSGEHYGCGGALINHRYVLTAGHCVRTNKAHILVQVRLGEWNLDTEVDCDTPRECNAPPLDVDIEEITLHPAFDSRNLTNDVALIRLRQTVVYTEWIQPICLPDNTDRDYTDETFWVAGWGQTESGTPSPVKLKLEVRYVNLDTCRVAYRRLQIALGNGTMCAGGRLGQDTCAGDSGGPLMKLLPSDSRTNFYAVGIVSLGPSRCGIEGWAGVYTKVSHYINWIKANLRP